MLCIDILTLVLSAGGCFGACANAVVRDLDKGMWVPLINALDSLLLVVNILDRGRSRVPVSVCRFSPLIYNGR
jgi:hypothetical protein